MAEVRLVSLFLWVFGVAVFQKFVGRGGGG